MNSSKFSFIDLFAGIGGFRTALEDVGGRCVGFSEVAPDAISAYCTNYKENPECNLGDITKLQSLPKHDFLTGGVPCQSWSIAGKNLGFDDKRGQLWNDALFLLKMSMPEVFIFENVKGLADPRNNDALAYIMNEIKDAGYYAEYHLLNAFDFGVPQNRVRIYIIGFKNKKFFDRFSLPEKHASNSTLRDIILDDTDAPTYPISVTPGKQSISANAKGQNDYFLFNDLRSGPTTIHSWDLIETDIKEKHICMILLKNRRKRTYGPLDGNPLALHHFQDIDSSIRQKDIDTLIEKGILKAEKYLFVFDAKLKEHDTQWSRILSKYIYAKVDIDTLKSDHDFRLSKINVKALMDDLCENGLAECVEVRYDFKNTKISTGINGINRIFLPSSRVYPTLVASDTNDYVTDVFVKGDTEQEYKINFLNEVYFKGNYRQISKEEACAIQGFPRNFILPEGRAKWMKLIGNSVAVKLIRQLAEKVIETGVFDERDYVPVEKTARQPIQQLLFNDL